MTLQRICFLLILSVSSYGLTGCTKNTPMAAMPEAQIAVSTTPPTETRTYVNTKYNFTFTYPKIFDRNKEHADSDGIELKNEHASLMIFGRSVAQDKMVQMAKQETTATKYSVEQYEKDGYYYCYATRTAGQIEITMIFRYPANMTDQFEETQSLLLNEITR